jgi:FkbM family methyltransferase
MSPFRGALLEGDVDPNTWPLERILSEPADEVAAAIAAQRSRAVAEADHVYIYGSGQNGRWLAKLFDQSGRKPAGFIDDLPSRQGTSVEQLPVFGPEALADATERTLVVVSMFSPGHSYIQTRRRLEKYRCRVISLPVALTSFFSEQLPFYFVDRPEHLLAAGSSLLALSGALVDQAALERFWRYTMFLITFDDRFNPALERERFARPEIGSDAVFIDGGAFNGDTLAVFLEARGDNFKRALLFEPDPENVAALRSSVAALPEPLQARIEVHDCGLWSGSGELSFTPTGTPATQLSTEGSTRVKVRALDELHLPSGSYLVKLDVEGGEEEAIRGMSSLIRRHRPYIEAALYHKQADLYRLPQLILGLDDRYRFDIRSYGHDGTDTMICALPR